MTLDWHDAATWPIPIAEQTTNVVLTPAERLGRARRALATSDMSVLIADRCGHAGPGGCRHNRMSDETLCPPHLINALEPQVEPQRWIARAERANFGELASAFGNLYQECGASCHACGGQGCCRRSA